MTEAATRLRLFIDEFRARRTDDTISSLVTVFADDCRLPLQASDIEAVLAENERLKSRGIEDMQHEIKELRDTLSRCNIECHSVSHRRGEYHESCEECGVVKRIEELLEGK